MNDYVVINYEVLSQLIKSMNSKTIYILDYLISVAEGPEKEINVKYRDIEDALHIGHTCVGYNMRLLISLRIIEKLGASKYKISPDVINIISISKVF